MAHDVFVSYSHKDKPIADAVVAGLENKGIRCWIAPRDITPGSSWGAAIIDAIEGSQFMVIILSGHSNNSNQVVREVERAVANNVIIIPFRIENIDPTGAMAYFLSTEHWLDAITRPLEGHIKKLANTILIFQEKTDTSSVEQSVLTKPQKLHRVTSPYLVALFIIVFVGLLSFLLLPKIFSKNQPSTDQTRSTITTDITQNDEILPTATLTLAPTAEPKFEILGEYRTSRAAKGLFIEGNSLYLANGADNLMRMNVSDPTNPLPLDVYSAFGANEVVVSEGIAYILTGDDHSKSLLVIDFNEDLSYTFDPEETNIPWDLSHLAVHNNLVHILSWNYWGIIDMKDPSTAREIWNWEPSSNSGVTCRAIINGDIAYIGGGWTGLHIFDISDPKQPELIGGFDTPNWIVGMTLADDILYLSLGESGVLALDVTDQTRPLMMGSIDLPGYVGELSANNDILYGIYIVLEDYDVNESGVYAIDISEPSEMSLLTTYNELHEASDIQATDDAVFITDEPWGLVVLNLIP